MTKLEDMEVGGEITLKAILERVDLSHYGKGFPVKAYFPEKGKSLVLSRVLTECAEYTPPPEPAFEFSELVSLKGEHVFSMAPFVFIKYSPDPQYCQIVSSEGVTYRPLVKNIKRFEK